MILQSKEGIAVPLDEPLNFKTYVTQHIQRGDFVVVSFSRHIWKHSENKIIMPWSILINIGVILRVRAVFHMTVRVCHVYCNFKIGFTCWITIIFGTLKDGSLLTLASNICFSYRNMFQNGVDALSKIVDAFLSKSSKFYLVRIIR